MHMVCKMQLLDAIVKTQKEIKTQILFYGWYTPSTPIFEAIHPPCNAIFKSQSTFSTISKENKHSNINEYSFRKNKYHLKRTIQL